MQQSEPKNFALMKDLGCKISKPGDLRLEKFDRKLPTKRKNTFLDACRRSLWSEKHGGFSKVAREGLTKSIHAGCKRQS